MILQCVPDYREIYDWAELAEKYGLCFEYNEFFNPQILDDKELTDEIIRRYSSLGRNMSKDTLHGAFFDICINSQDPKIRSASIYRIEQSIGVARRLGVRGVVFHTNYLVGFKSEKYRENWKMKNIEFWSEICEKYKDINLYLENMFDESPELLSCVASGLEGIKNFGVCLDIAHAQLASYTVDEFVDSLAMYVKHIHINDNDGLEDLHMPVGDGLINWAVLRNEKLFMNDPSVLIEVNSTEKLEKSLSYLNKISFIKQTCK